MPREVSTYTCCYRSHSTIRRTPKKRDGSLPFRHSDLFGTLAEAFLFLEHGCVAKIEVIRKTTNLQWLSSFVFYESIDPRGRFPVNEVEPGWDVSRVKAFIRPIGQVVDAPLYRSPSTFCRMVTISRCMGPCKEYGCRNFIMHETSSRDSFDHSVFCTSSNRHFGENVPADV